MPRLPAHFFRRIVLLPATLLLAFGIAGCASRRKEPTPQAATQRVHTVGKVATVNETLGFVLIDAVETLQPGTPLRTITPSTRMETGTLSVSPEQSRPFYIGEIGSGRPQRGDWVVRTGTAVPVAATVETPGAPTAPAPHVPVALPDELPPLPEFEETAGPTLSAPVASDPPPAPAPAAPPPPSAPANLPEFPPLPPLPDPTKSAFD